MRDSGLKKKWRRLKLGCSFLLSFAILLSAFVIHNESVYAAAVKKRGCYYTLQQSYAPSYSNLFIKKVKVRGNKIITYGNFDYFKKQVDFEGGKTLKTKKRTFILSKKCKFRDDWGVPSGMGKISRRKALKMLKDVSDGPYDTGSCVIFVVKKGKVVRLMFGQE